MFYRLQYQEVENNRAIHKRWITSPALYETAEEAKKQALSKIKSGVRTADDIRVVEFKIACRFENNIKVVEEDSNV